MKVLQFSAGTGIHMLEAVILVCGQDLNVCICGGTHYHVGACALGIPRPSLNDPSVSSASVSVLTAVGHKEDEMVREAAHRLAKKFVCRVCVSAGVHIDNATKEDIRMLWENFLQLLDETEHQVNILPETE